MPDKVLSIGELLWDLLPDRRVLGGAPFNLAYRLHSLGTRALFCSRLGNDDLGREAREQVASLGVDTALVQEDVSLPSGTVAVAFDNDNEPVYEIIRGVAYDNISLDERLTAAARSADCICFGTLVQRAPRTRETLMELLDEATGIKLLDINLRKDCYTTETVTGSLEHASIVKLNEDEAGILGKMFSLDAESVPVFCIGLMERFGLECCLVTLGDKGVYARSATAGQVYVPGNRIVFADALGAGDAFTAGFLAHYLEGASLKTAVCFGNALGGLVASTHGATQPVTRKAVERLLNDHNDFIYHAELQKYL